MQYPGAHIRRHPMSSRRQPSIVDRRQWQSILKIYRHSKPVAWNGRPHLVCWPTSAGGPKIPPATIRLTLRLSSCAGPHEYRGARWEFDEPIRPAEQVDRLTDQFGARQGQIDVDTKLPVCLSCCSPAAARYDAIFISVLTDSGEWRCRRLAPRERRQTTKCSPEVA